MEEEREADGCLCEGLRGEGPPPPSLSSPLLSPADPQRQSSGRLPTFTGSVVFASSQRRNGERGKAAGGEKDGMAAEAAIAEVGWSVKAHPPPRGESPPHPATGGGNEGGVMAGSSIAQTPPLGRERGNGLALSTRRRSGWHRKKRGKRRC